MLMTSTVVTSLRNIKENIGAGLLMETETTYNKNGNVKISFSIVRVSKINHEMLRAERLI